jgi:Fe2+ or Zn2+ uptake regulation protein
LTAEEIVARCGHHRGSVYRNLGVLADSGVVHAIAGYAEFTRYELDEALIGHHHHLACMTCGALSDFALPADLESQLENAVAAVARRARFAASGHRLDAVGLCSDCRTIVPAAWSPAGGLPSVIAEHLPDSRDAPDRRT